MTARPAAGRAPVRGAALQYLDDDDDYFGRQPARRSDLPDPEPMLRNLTHCVIEVLAGARDLEQLARWVTDDVYRNLSKRVVLAARARRVEGPGPAAAGVQPRPGHHLRAAPTASSRPW